MGSTMEPHADCVGLADHDVELVAALRAGDDAAVERFVREYGASLIGLCRSLTGSEHEAQDAVQDALIRALRSLDTLERPESFSGWVKRIAANAAIQRVRDRCRRRERPIESMLPTYHQDGHRDVTGPRWDASGVSSLEREEVRRKVREAMEQLPDAYRTVLMLRDLAGFNTEQAADALGISQGLVKVRLHRARQALRELLEEEFGS